MTASTTEPTRLWDLIEYPASHHAEKPAIIEPAKDGASSHFTLSYRDLSISSRKLAAALRSLGAKNGSRIGCLLHNSAEFVQLWFAVSLLGAILVPFNFALKGLLLEYQITDSEISILFVDSRLREAIPKLQSTKVRNLVWVNRRESIVPPDFGIKSLHFQDLLDFPEIEDPSNSETVAEETAPLAILYTSGTTGDPKGVVLSHRAYLNRTREICNLFGTRSGDIFYNTLPLFHTSGQVMTTLPAFRNSGTVILEEWFHASRFWRNASLFGARFTFLLMTMMSVLLKRDEEFVPNKLELALCGGATGQTWSDFEKRFSPIKLLEGYGMTETCGVAIFNSREHLRVGSIGKPLPSVAVRISENGESAGKDSKERGEILLRPLISVTMMSEYFKKKEETESSWQNGWFHTGDLGYVDDGGFVYFVERKKDIIRRRGENISPGDIERVVSTHDNILECSAVGIKSELGEEEIALFLVVKEKFADLQPFLSWLDAMLPYYMMPSKLNFVESLPKTANHKVQRNRLREGIFPVDYSIDLAAIGFKTTKRF